MGSIQQIYTSGIYGDARQTLGEVYRSVYESKESVDQQYYPYRLSRHSRSAWVVSCRSWLWRGWYIPLFVNPSDVQWSIPRRGTVQKTAAGAVRNTWLNRFRNTYFDEFTLNITFQSGNIMPSAAYVDRNLTNYADLNSAYQNPQVPPGLLNFYRFLELLDVPKLAGAAENRHIIIMHTRVFPVLRLEGFFTEEPITFAESDKDANHINWTASFQVYRTYPRITNSNMLARVYAEFIRTVAFNEAVPMDRLRSLQQGGQIFKEGIDGLDAGIPTGTATTKTIPNSRAAGIGKSTAGGGTRAATSTLQTKGSAARGTKTTTLGEVLEQDRRNDVFFGG